MQAWVQIPVLHKTGGPSEIRGRPQVQETLLVLVTGRERRRTQRTDAGKTTAIRPGSHSSQLELSGRRKTNSPKSPSTGGWVGATLSTRLLAVSGVGQPLVLECQK